MPWRCPASPRSARTTSRCLGEQSSDDRLHRRPGERRLAREHFIKHGAERVDVAARIDASLAHRLLGRHVLRRPERKTRLRHSLAAGVLNRQSDSEIRYQGMTALEQDALRFDVAMDDASCMSIR